MGMNCPSWWCFFSTETPKTHEAAIHDWILWLDDPPNSLRTPVQEMVQQNKMNMENIWNHQTESWKIS